MDYYNVGPTSGAGNMAPYVNDTIRYSANYQHWKVLDTGPLRSSFQLWYDSWDAGGIKVKTTKIITLDAGSQLNRIENVYTNDSNRPLAVVIGIIKRPESGVLSLNEQQGIMGYWEPTHGEDGTAGVGTVLTIPLTNITVETTRLLDRIKVKNNNPIV